MIDTFLILVPGALLLQGAVAYLMCLCLFRLWMPLPLMAALTLCWCCSEEFMTSPPTTIAVVFSVAPAVLGSYCLSAALEKKRFITYPIAFATMVLVSHICSKWVLGNATFNKETYWFDLSALSFAAGSPSITAFLLWRASRPRFVTHNGP